MNLWNLWTDRNLWTDMNLWNLTLGETEQVRLKKYRLNSSGCLNVKKLMMTNVGKDIEKLELPYFYSGDVS